MAILFIKNAVNNFLINSFQRIHKYLPKVIKKNILNLLILVSR